MNVNDYLRDKVIGMYLGIAIGDALGMPVETLTFEEIKSRFGRITDYIRPDGHKWYDGWPAGKITDDTQLSLEIARSLIDKKEIDLDDIARNHIHAFYDCCVGWGGSTKNSVIRLMKNGGSWKDSGEPNGAGNGVAMKVAPLGAYFVLNYVLSGKTRNKNAMFEIMIPFNEKIFQLSSMTHRTDMAYASGLAQVYAIKCCLLPDYPGKTFEKYFLDALSDMCYLAEYMNIDKENTLYERMCELRESDFYKKESPERIAKLYDGATCYAYNSLPFTYGMFLRGYGSIETLYDTVSAGGDTDSNGSMVGALLGALNGTKIFPQHLVKGLWNKDEILEVANQFCDSFIK